MRKRKISFFFALYDAWIGAYFDRDKRTWYICLLPCCVLKIERAINKALCEWHEGDYGVDMEMDGPPGCQGCGNMYKVKDCEGLRRLHFCTLRHHVGRSLLRPVRSRPRRRRGAHG